MDPVEKAPSRFSRLRFLKQAGSYVAVRLASQALVLISTLLLARLLPIEAFAVIGTATLIQAFLLPTSGLALHKGLERLYFSYGGDEQPAKIFTIFVASMVLNALTCVFYYVVLSQFLRLEFIADWEIAVVLISTLLQSAQYVPLVVLRCREKLGEFALYQLIFVIATQFFVLAGVFLGGDVSYYFHGTLVGSIFGFLIWVVWLRSACRAEFVGIGAEFRYALPSVPIGILEALQQTADRYILQLLVPSAQFAAYTLAQRLSAPINTLAAGAKSAIYPILYRISDERSIKLLLTDTTNLFVAFFGSAINLLAIFACIVIQFFLSDEYAGVFPIFVVVLIGFLFRVQEIFFGIGADVKMRLDKQFYVLLPVLFVQIALSVGLTFWFGVWGAAWAFAAGGVVRTGAMALLGHSLLPRTTRLGQYVVIMLSALLPLLVYLWVGGDSSGLLGYDKLLVAVPIVTTAAVVKLEIDRARRKR